MTAPPPIRQQWRRLQHYYTARLAEFGDDVRTLGWGSTESQARRFAVLTEVGLRPGDSVLDVGAGLGDFYAYLAARGLSQHYTGLDLLPALVACAQARFPAARFRTGDLRLLADGERFDVVVASGIFNVRVLGWRAFFAETVQAMWQRTERALAFNLLSCAASVRDPQNMYCRPEAMWRFCRTLSPWVVLRHDYLPHDFTLYVYRTEADSGR